MTPDTLDAIDNFMNDASDQAAAWYSIVQRAPVVVPSAAIAAQQNQAALVGQGSQTIATPLGSSTTTQPSDATASLLVIAALVFVVYLVLR